MKRILHILVLVLFLIGLFPAALAETADELIVGVRTDTSLTLGAKEKKEEQKQEQKQARVEKKTEQKREFADVKEKRKLILTEAKADVQIAKDAVHTLLAQQKEQRKRFAEEYKIKKEELKEAKKEEFVMKGKEFLLRHVALMETRFETKIEKLNMLAERVENSELKEETKTALLARIRIELKDIEANLVTLADIKTKIKTTTTREDLKKISTELKEIVTDHAEETEAIMTVQAQHVLQKIELLKENLDTRIEKTKSTGDVETITTAEKKYAAAVKSAQENIEAALAKLDASYTTREEKKKAIAEARALMKDAREHIKEAHKVLRALFKEIKTLPDTDVVIESNTQVTTEGET